MACCWQVSLYFWLDPSATGKKNPSLRFKEPLLIKTHSIGFIGGENIWRYFFWITGSMTVAWAAVVALFLPDNPIKAKFVNEREKAIIVDRIRADQVSDILYPYSSNILRYIFLAVTSFLSLPYGKIWRWLTWQTGVENKTFKKEQMIEAFTDPKTWLAVLLQLWVNIPNGGWQISLHWSSTALVTQLNDRL